MTIALTVVTTDLADALAIAWDAFRSAAREDLTGRYHGRIRTGSQLWCEEDDVTAAVEALKRVQA